MPCILLMLIAWQTYSQGVTNDSVTLDFDIAQKILLELLDYDRLMTNKVELNLDRCLKLQQEKDSAIAMLSLQSELYKKQLELANRQNEMIKRQLVKKNKGNGWVWSTLGFAAGTVTGIILIK